MGRPANPPLPGAHDPDSLAAYMVRWLAHLAVKHYADATLVDRRTALSQLILWCAERGIEQPRDVTKTILERYQRHLFYHRKADGAPLSASTQAQRLIPIRGFFRWLAKENFILSNPAGAGAAASAETAAGGGADGRGGWPSPTSATRSACATGRSWRCSTPRRSGAPS